MSLKQQITNVITATAIAVAVFFIGSFCMHKFVYTPTGTTSGFAIIDGARLKAEAAPFLAIRELANNEVAKINRDFSGSVETLQKFAKLAKDPNIPAKKRAEHKKEYDQKLAIVESEIQERKGKLRRQLTPLMQLVDNTVMDTVGELAKKHRLKIILNTKVIDIVVVFFSEPSIDLTNEAIAVVNRTISSEELENIFFKTP